MSSSQNCNNNNSSINKSFSIDHQTEDHHIAVHIWMKIITVNLPIIIIRVILLIMIVEDVVLIKVDVLMAAGKILDFLDQKIV